MSEKPLAETPGPPASAPILSPAARACMALVEAFSHDEPLAGRRALLILALRSALEATRAPPTRRIACEETLEAFFAECALGRGHRAG